MRKILVFFVLLYSFTSVQAQDSNAYKQIHFFKLNQSNDLFTYLYQSDKYFTDGVNIELAHSIFNN